jgi:hypothetical protein
MGALPDPPPPHAVLIKIVKASARKDKYFKSGLQKQSCNMQAVMAWQPVDRHSLVLGSEHHTETEISEWEKFRTERLPDEITPVFYATRLLPRIVQPGWESVFWRPGEKTIHR